MNALFHDLGGFALNVIWQLAAFAVVLGLCDLTLRRTASGWRVTFWTVGLIVAAALPWLPAPRYQAAGTAGPIIIQTKAVSQTSGGSVLFWPGMVVAALALWRGGRLLHGLIALNQIRRRAAPKDGVLVSNAVATPLTFGIWRPVIVVPARFWENASAEVKSTVLAHEAAHIQRRDYAWNLLLECASIAVWWHPAILWMKRRAAALREFACDEQASRSVPAYARSMVDAARLLMESRNPGMALGFFDSNNLEDRIMKLTKPLARIPFRWAIASLAGASAILAAFTWLLVAHPVALAEEPEKIYKIADGVKSPRLVHKVEPQYTEEARDAGISGTTILKVVISSTGIVQKAEVVQSLDPGLDANAMEALTHWKFEPGIKDGKPVAVAATVEVNFRLE